MFKYFPHTDADLQTMFRKVGIKSLDDLYAEVPEQIRFRGEYQLPEEMSEIEVRQLFDKLGAQNKPLTCFAGAGVYDHYTPSAIPQLLSRSEFLTSYTPYQAEISQGTLHYIFEYQSMMAELTGMDISNASMYDGTTATAEAVMMAVAAGKKQNKVLVSETVDPKTLAVVKTYAHFHGIEIEMVPAKDGVTDLSTLNSQLSADVAGVLVQQPNFYGIVEDQSLGIPMQWGGPYVGYMCCTEKLIRKMPGRIVGMTQDNRGQRAFVLTLQAREQHIRRQKATSNICSNQSLMALWATVYMSLMGKQGLKEAAELSYAGAHYLCDELLKTGKFSLVYNQPFFNEFVVRYSGDVDALQKRLTDNGIFGGIKLDAEKLMFAVTEKRTKEEIDNLVKLAAL